MKRRAKIIRMLYMIPLFCLAAVFLAPILMMLFGSLKSAEEVLDFDLSIPSKFHFENYSHAFVEGNIGRGYLNSIFLTAVSATFSIIFGAFAGIILGRRSERFIHHFYYYFLIGQTITLQTASTFYLLKNLGLYGTHTGVIFVFVALRIPFTVMTFSSFIKGIPREIDEAAVMDGCSPMRMTFGVLFPIMKPILITNIILTVLTVWNNFMIPLFFLGRSSKWPVTNVIYNFFGQYCYDWQYVFAALTLTVAPMIVLFLCLQKYIVGGITAGAVKG